MIIFETERLIVRKPDFELDADDFYQLNSDEEVMRYIRPVKTREECDQYLQEIIAMTNAKPALGRWVIIEKEHKHFVGVFAIIPIENTELTQLGYAFLKQHWGKGYATEITEGGIRYYFDNCEEKEVYAVTEAPNVASQKVLNKTGFVMHSTRMEEGKELWQYVLRRS